MFYVWDMMEIEEDADKDLRRKVSKNPKCHVRIPVQPWILIS